MHNTKSLPRCLGAGLLFSAVLLAQAHAVPVPGQGTWESSLQARDLDGNFSNGPEAFYDTAQGITWLADAFQARTSGYQARPYYPPGDSLIWPHALEWADNLVLYGIDDWRLPRSFDTGAPGCTILNVGGECGWNVNPASSELAHMFHVSLGNVSYLAPNGTQAPGGGLSNTGPFFNLLAGYYWSETDYNTVHAWNFNFNFGYQAPTIKTAQGSAVWAVLDGDRGTPMTAVPEPGAAALMALGLTALVGRCRWRRPAR
jgi:hypothetical protein